MMMVDQLHALVNQLPFAANVRDIRTDKYTIVNKLQALNHGFSNTHSMIGLTVSDFFEHRLKKLSMIQGSLEREKEYQKFIYQANRLSEESNVPREFKICTLFPTGFIYIGILRKIPVINEAGLVSKVLTFSQETTASVNLLFLYHLYKEHYLAQPQAIMQFLKYLNILDYFNKLPTNQEVTTLLMLRRSSISKYAARQLKISYRTIEEYKARLRNKLKLTSLDELLILLRMRSEKLEEKTWLHSIYPTNNLHQSMEVHPFLQPLQSFQNLQANDLLLCAESEN